MTPDRLQYLERHLVDRIGLTEANATDFIGIFERDAARVVRSTPFSGSGMFPSFKNRTAIEYESRTGELPYDRLLEHDEDVLAYAHQPDFPVKGWYVNASGRRIPITSTVDRAVIRADRAVLVEVKTEERLAGLRDERPGFVVWDPDAARWRNPTFEAYLAPFGLEFEYVTPASYNQTKVRNIEALGDAFRAPLPSPAILMSIVDRVRARPGCTVTSLVSDGATLGDVLVLIAAHLVYADLDRDDLSQPSAVPVFANRTVAGALTSARTPSFAIGTALRAPLSLRVGGRFAWQGARMEVVIPGLDKVLVREVEHPEGDGSWISRGLLEAGWRAGEVVVEDVTAQSAADAHAGARLARERYEKTSQHGLDLAVRRWDLLKAWRATSRIPVGASRRSLHRWERERREMEALTGDPFVGLCPLPPSGNTNDKLHARVAEITVSVIIERYLIANGDLPVAVVAEVRRRCQLENLPKPHARTIQRRIKGIPEEVVVEAREGRKAAYTLKQWAAINPDAAAPNGDFAFAVGHIDGTLLDLECVHSRTRLPLGRPWLHRLVDGHTGLELARYIGFVEPSEGVVLELLWRCVVRWRVLPRRLTVDVGSEHRGKALKVLGLSYGVVIDFRPKSRGRSGAPVERSMLTLDLDLLYQLAGNTQSRKNVRQETPQVNPTNHAVHSINTLDAVLDQYNAIVAERIADRLGDKRGKVLQDELAERAGTVIPYVALDERLRFLTLAPVVGTTRYLDPVKGFMVGRHTYHHDRFKMPPLARTNREVRYAPGDPTHVVVDTRNGFLRVECRSLASERVTSVDDIPVAAAERARTAAVADRANDAVRIELAAFRGFVEDASAREAELAKGVDPWADQTEGETKAAYLERLRHEDTLATQRAHPAGNPPSTASAVDPAREPVDGGPELYEPYADAWEGIA